MPVPSNLPKAGQHIFERVMNSLKGKTNPRTEKPYTDEERGRIAWSAVKRKYTKKDDGWELKSIPESEGELCFNSEPLEFKSEEGNYYFTGYLSTFDLDLVNDMVTASCMQDMLGQIKMGMNGVMRSFKGSPDHDVYWFEDPQLKPISKIVDATLDNKGILIKGMFNQAHPDFNWQEIQNGFYDGLSIEYKPDEFSFKDMNGKKVRVLSKVQLKGYGHTPRPANPFSKLTDCFVKSLEFADAEELMDSMSVKDMVTSHLENDMKTWMELSEKAKEEAESDKELIKSLSKAAQMNEMKSEERAAEKTEVKEMTEEKKEEIKSETQPIPQTEVKTEVKQEEPKKDEKEEEEEDKEKEEKKECAKPKTEVKSTEEIKSLEEQIKAIVKEELKSLVPEKKSLSDTTDKFPEIKSQPTTLVGEIVKRLGG
jgi:cation transport regulator ChaB